MLQWQLLFPEVSGYPSFDQTQATVSNKTSSGSPQSSSTSTSASIAVCDQTIVVLAANQVFVGDSGCYIVSSSPGNVITSQTSTPSTSAIGSSGSNSRGVQIIQVVPQVVVASSSETGLPPSVTYNTISTPDVGEPHLVCITLSRLKLIVYSVLNNAVTLLSKIHIQFFSNFSTPLNF
uniref:Uncharacterized protein n=1 Tax=Trichuris muris TaxID=70415 RepID=A0A5S6Q594_TRIMR